VRLLNEAPLSGERESALAELCALSPSGGRACEPVDAKRNQEDTMTATPDVVRSIDFSKPPRPGTVLMVEGQRYEVVRTEPYRRKDGRMTTLIVWQTWCAETGHPFELTTLLTAKSINRRCPGHRSPGRAVSAAGKKRRQDWLLRRPGKQWRTKTTKL
jgi:hypothetical protein